MFKKANRKQMRQARVRRVRAKVYGTAERPRFAVHRTLTRITAQLIDDVAAVTLFGMTDKGLTGTPTEKAKQLGQKMAEAAKAKNITQAVYDRSGYQYHGRVAAVAEGAREAGLQL
jgi:large subunit ribosomal protein L18